MDTADISAGGLEQELTAAAAAIGAAVGPAAVVAVLAAEPNPGGRVYVGAAETTDGSRVWLAVDGAGRVVESRRVLREAVSIAALCELAEEAAGGGDLDDLLARLVSLRVTERPEGIEEAEEAVRSLQRVLGSAPHLASPQRLDAIGAATRELELALDPVAGSPFAAALRSGQSVVEELLREVEAAYAAPLE